MVVVMVVVRASMGRYGRFCWVFDANRNGQAVSLAAELAGNSPGEGLKAAVFSEGAAVVR